jgi:hypothetical protein
VFWAQVENLLVFLTAKLGENALMVFQAACCCLQLWCSSLFVAQNVYKTLTENMTPATSPTADKLAAGAGAGAAPAASAAGAAAASAGAAAAAEDAPGELGCLLACVHVCWQGCASN